MKQYQPSPISINSRSATNANIGNYDSIIQENAANQRQHTEPISIHQNGHSPTSSTGAAKGGPIQARLPKYSPTITPSQRMTSKTTSKPKYTHA